MTLVLEHEDEFAIFDVYELPDESENRYFVITHIHNKILDGVYLKYIYSQGQLTAAPSGNKVIATVSKY